MDICCCSWREIPGREILKIFILENWFKNFIICFLQFQDTFPKHQLVQQTTTLTNIFTDTIFQQIKLESARNKNNPANNLSLSLSHTLYLFCIILAWDGNKLSISSTHFLCIFSRIVNIGCWWSLNVEYETNLLIWLLKEIEEIGICFAWYVAWY